MRHELPSLEHVDTLCLKALRRLVSGLAERARVAEASYEVVADNERALSEENASLHLENANLKAENQKLRDELARVKNLPSRPSVRSSGMEKNTEPDRVSSEGVDGQSKRRRGPKQDTDRVDREVVLYAEVPAGSRFKGYKSCYVRELVLRAEVVHYRREYWITPDGQTVLAPLPPGIVGGYGPNLRQFCLMLHNQGQVTTERLSTLLNDIGVEISKRQVVRLLTKSLDGFVAEDAAVLHAGLVSAAYVTVDDTGARHARNNFYTTHIGGQHFTVFRTTKTKSRLNFLTLLRGNYTDYVLNDAAYDYLQQRKIDPTLIARLRRQGSRYFQNKMPFLRHLMRNGMTPTDKDALQIVSEAGLWGTIRYHGLLGDTVIISDDAGQFRVGNHALCWVHSERLLQKLMPATQRQVQLVENIRDLIWSFYKALKAFRQKPAPGSIKAFGQRFERIFSMRTGYEDLDKLLTRLLRRKAELLRVLERPEIPLHTNASENDLRSCVTKRKISGGTMSRDGLIARDTMLGLMKTCKKLGLSFWHFLGDRLMTQGRCDAIPPLPTLVMSRSLQLAG
ncbi:IS66 family transposase [Brucella rhizosphaerae]|uniref:IS66 family transposase n=1 Tax=Brucella rhizosphaerae TaxID=571254 RepID=UPI0004B8BAD0